MESIIHPITPISSDRSKNTPIYTQKIHNEMLVLFWRGVQVGGLDSAEVMSLLRQPNRLPGYDKGQGGHFARTRDKANILKLRRAISLVDHNSEHIDQC